MAADCARFQYFYGVLPHTKYICIYDTLLEKSSAEEIEAILAHELGHWAHSDPTKLLVLSQVQIITIMSLFTLFINNASLFRAFGFQQATNTIAGKLQSTVQRALHKQTTVQIAYLPIVVGLELFQMVLHPLDSLGMSPLSVSLIFLVSQLTPLANLPLQSNSASMPLYAGWSTPQMSEFWRRWAKEAGAHLSYPSFAAKQPRAPLLTSKSSSESVADEDREGYSSLLSKSLIKIHVQKCVAMSAHLSTPLTCFTRTQSVDNAPRRPLQRLPLQSSYPDGATACTGGHRCQEPVREFCVGMR